MANSNVSFRSCLSNAPRVFTREEVAEHNEQAFESNKKAPYIILHNKVYDVTEWVNDHPGGQEILISNAGMDATAQFEEQQHSISARARRLPFFVGDIVHHEQQLYIGRNPSGQVQMVYFDHSLGDQQTKPLEEKLEEARNEAGIPKDEFENYKVSVASAQEEMQELRSGLTFTDEQYPLQVKLERRAGRSSQGGGESSRALQAAMGGLLALYIRKALSSPPIPAVTYSKSLRHAHLGMALGTFVSIGSVQAAVRSDGAAKKNYMTVHKTSGVLMFFALLLRIKLRFSSAIPPSFPGNQSVQLLERGSHKLLYLILLLMPTSGAIFAYFSGTGVPFLGSKPSPSNEDLRVSQQAIDFHRALGRFLEYAWLPFHLGSSAYHSMNGRDIVRRISPFL